MAKSSKGSQYERSICKKLSLWWTQDLKEPRDDIFWRTSQSGGRATTRAKQNISTAYSQGDITFIDPIGSPFIDTCLLELKRGYTKDIEVLNFIDKVKGEPILLKWWIKGEGEKEESNRKWTMIIFRRDRHKSCIMLNTEMIKEIELLFNRCSDDCIKIKRTPFNFTIIRLNSFLEWVHPKFFDTL
jgi:hypothetical protein